MSRRPGAATLSRLEWEQLEHELKVRSGARCEARSAVCAAPGGSVEKLPRNRVEIQHRRARGMGGTDLAETNSLANLLLLCGACHRWVESRPSDPRGAGWPDLAEQRGLWVRHGPTPVAQVPLVLWSGRQVLLDPDDPFYLPHPDEWRISNGSARV